MRWTKFFNISTTAFLLCQIFRRTVAQECVGQNSFNGKMLKGFTFKKIKVSNPTECFQACNDNDRCQSFNYVILKDICELNNRAKEAGLEDLEPDPHRYYFQVKREPAPPVVVVLSCFAVGVADINMIADGKITASSVLLQYYPYKGRLNGEKGWCPSSTSNRNDHLQVDMGAVYPICAVATQGKANGSWVKSYKVSLSTDGTNWTIYQEGNIEKIFQANNDLNTIVQHSLANEAQARYVRFYPVTYQQYPCMRVEIFVMQ